ncbi:Protein TFG [Nymphon striatum]|nr:Protein TFG [Nymphon striatum]
MNQGPPVNSSRDGEGLTRLDLSGKLIIKAQLGEDIRRIPIHNEEITYDELVLMMQRVFRGNLSNNDEVTIKYKDEDGDLVTIFDDSDLSFAIQCSRILKITIFVNGKPLPLESEKVKYIRKELQGMRNRINQILDELKLDSDVIPPTNQASETVNEIKNSVNQKEFDPLNSQKIMDKPESNISNKVASSIGIPDACIQYQRGEHERNEILAPSDIETDFKILENDTRAGTPDSASSLGSSSFSQKPQHLQSMPQQPPTGSQSPFQQMQLNPQAQQALQQQQQQQQQQQPPSSQLPQTNATMGHQQNSQVPNMPHADHQFQRMQSPHHQHQLQYQQNQTQMGFQQPGYPSNQTIRPAVSAPGYPNVPTDQNQQQQMTGSPAHVPPGYPQQHQSSQQQYNYPAASTGQPSHQLEHNKAQGPSNQMPQGPPNQMPAGPTFPTPYNAGGGPPHQPAGNPYSRGPQPGGYVRPTASYPPGYQ